MRVGSRRSLRCVRMCARSAASQSMRIECSCVCRCPWRGCTAQLYRALGLNASQMRVLLALWDGGTMSISERGVRVGLSHPAATTLADRLEAKELATREAGGSDRRRVELHITQLAERQMAFASTDLQDAFSLWIASGAHGWERFVEGLAQVRDVSHQAAKRLEQTLFEPVRQPGKRRHSAGFEHRR